MNAGGTMINLYSFSKPEPTNFWGVAMQRHIYEWKWGRVMRAFRSVLRKQGIAYNLLAMQFLWVKTMPECKLQFVGIQTLICQSTDQGLRRCKNLAIKRALQPPNKAN